MNGKFTLAQRRILSLCFLSYSAAYTGRLNISAALPELQSALSLTAAQAGTFQTVFALVYAAGQIINGALADHIRAPRNIALGLIISSACNLGLGIADSFGTMLFLWALNGAAQSMLWTPIVRLTAQWFNGSERDRAAFALSVAIVLGHFAAWALSGALAAVMSWRFSFFIPSLVMTAAGIAAWIFLRENPSHSTVSSSAPMQTAEPAALFSLLHSTWLGALLFCCVCLGFVRDGIVSWTPTILSAVSAAALGSAALSLIIPVLNLFGVLLVRRCYLLLHGSPRSSVGLVLAAGVLLTLLLHAVGGSAVTCAVIMGLCCALLYGATPMLTTYCPLEYEKFGRVGLVAGLVDCFIYIGAALAGIFSGIVSDAAGWQGVYLMWAAISAAGMLAALLSAKGRRHSD